MQILEGRRALSDFRLRGLLARLPLKLDTSEPRALLDARACYCLAADAPLDDAGAARLAALLGAGETAADAASFYVAPRPGTLSPWSSKATEIARNCGLGVVQRIERALAWRLGAPLADQAGAVAALVHDRMTEAVYPDRAALGALFEPRRPAPLRRFALGTDAEAALRRADAELGLGLSAEEIAYLAAAYAELERDPSDCELMMFAQANSEHCRHKIFNAGWTIDGEAATHSLFAMIRNTAAQAPGRLLSAYTDNAAVATGYSAERFWRDPGSGAYGFRREPAHLLAKVETHNHPTAIAPGPGAATGAGGEIRDEAATGRGASPKAGLTGFSVSNLRIPGFTHHWEHDAGRPARIASALEIMLEGPVGAAAFNNEFGRPALGGYFRSYEMATGEGTARGYHKPIMLAGGLGNVRPAHVHKARLSEQALLIVLGGPAMLVGLGGGAASSVSAGSSDVELDFASVQRANPEMQRRCQEVIEACWALGEANPVVSIHDVGAGGLSNALPELLHASGRGGAIDLDRIPRADAGLSPLELWCNEAQERYVLALEPGDLERFAALCARERCPWAVVGEARREPRLRATAGGAGEPAIDVPLEVLLGRPPRLQRRARRGRHGGGTALPEHIELAAAIDRVLQLPAVADKRFLVTIGDRTVSGLVARDQMVGPWQLPVADCAVTCASYRGYTGEAMAIGERAPLAVADAASAARMAVGEAVTNIAGARIMRLGDLILSANWMAAAGHGEEDAALYDAVCAVGLELCPALDLAIPVGKDSLSMRTHWHDGARAREVVAPVSLVVTAFAPVVDVRQSLTPALAAVPEASVLVLLDLGRGRRRLGGSALAQVHGCAGGEVPDLDSPAALKGFFAVVQALNEGGHLLAYHDRADGGLLVCAAEMALAGRLGVELELAPEEMPLPALFNEELGALMQVRAESLDAVLAAFTAVPALAGHARVVGAVHSAPELSVRRGGEPLYRAPLAAIQRRFSDTSYHLQRLRDDPDCAREEHEAVCDYADPGLALHLPAAAEPCAGPLPGGERPPVAILREQGVNGHREMAAAFAAAGFEPIDLHMSELVTGERTLAGFAGLAACGGFSYGDVLGAGAGWAASVRHNPRAAEAFAHFCERPDSFTLGVCNGCQMLAALRDLIPGARHWPGFAANRSEQFESRLVMVEVLPSPSLFLAGMAGARLPVAVAHGEGRVRFDSREDAAAALPALRYVDNHGAVAARYPANPNGSPGGLTAFTSTDGRATIMMPHPERLFRAVQYSWLPAAWRGEHGPWLRIFQNARRWLA